MQPKANQNNCVATETHVSKETTERREETDSSNYQVDNDYTCGDAIKKVSHKH